LAAAVAARGADVIFHAVGITAALSGFTVVVTNEILLQ
jgi:hypothetical protein